MEPSVPDGKYTHVFCYDLYSEIKITVIIVVFVVFVAVVISRPNSRSTAATDGV